VRVLQNTVLVRVFELKRDELDRRLEGTAQ
jgi:hypothetical protein